MGPLVIVGILATVTYAGYKLFFHSNEHANSNESKTGLTVNAGSKIQVGDIVTVPPDVGGNPAFSENQINGPNPFDDEQIIMKRQQSVSQADMSRLMAVMASTESQKPVDLLVTAIGFTSNPQLTDNGTVPGKPASIGIIILDNPPIKTRLPFAFENKDVIRIKRNGIILA